MNKGYQFVRWFPRWLGVYFMRVPLESDMSYIYQWYLVLGFWEVRKWSARKLTP